MADTDTQQILGAIKESGERTEAAITDLTKAIRGMSERIVEGFAAASGRAPVRNGNGGMYGLIATFATVVVSLAILFMGQLGSLRDYVDVLDKHQLERVTATDILLQKEIAASQALVAEEVLGLEGQILAEINATRSLDIIQQDRIDEIKQWFGPPKLRNDGP